MNPPLVQDATPHVVDGVKWCAHWVNVVQVITIIDEGLQLQENSFGLCFQQHLEFMDQHEIQQFYRQNWNRLTKAAGVANAQLDGLAALQMAQLQQQGVSSSDAMGQLPAQQQFPAQQLPKSPPPLPMQQQQLTTRHRHQMQPDPDDGADWKQFRAARAQLKHLAPEQF